MDCHKIQDKSLNIALIGLGYVGLPLAVEFGKHFTTIGFDVKSQRVEMLRRGEDATLEISPQELREAERLSFTTEEAALDGCDVFIVTVPTPVDVHKQPDLTPLIKASETVGRHLKSGGVVIFESTVYPGCTEEVCVPILERCSGLAFNREFFCGYSPERINPGDREHTLTRILKVTSGSTPEAAEFVDQLYNSILRAGTYRAPGIKVAEAAKVIENAQRDLNIAFVNELAKICHLIGIDTGEVLAAAGTKWNFLNFKPGLVGGHCIGVDPYYLTHKAQALGYLPEVILAGRRINDGMGQYVAMQAVKVMIRKGFHVGDAKVLQLGITFKENCPDIRNSRAIDVANGLREFGCRVDIFDPWADPAEVQREYGAESLNDPTLLKSHHYDAIVLAVAHDQFRDMSFDSYGKAGFAMLDLKGILPPNQVDWRL